MIYNKIPISRLPLIYSKPLHIPGYIPALLHVQSVPHTPCPIRPPWYFHTRSLVLLNRFSIFITHPPTKIKMSTIKMSLTLVETIFPVWYDEFWSKIEMNVKLLSYPSFQDKNQTPLVLMKRNSMTLWVAMLCVGSMKKTHVVANRLLVLRRSE